MGWNKKRYINLSTLLLLLLLTEVHFSTDQTKLDQECKTDLECSVPFVICSVSEGKCTHKKTGKFVEKEVIGMALMGVLNILCVVSGLGGGAILIPINLMFLDFSTKQAIAVSNGIMLFTGFAKFFVGLSRNHPTIPHKTLVDYNIVLLFIPTLMLGALYGATLSAILPDILQLIGLILVVISSLIKTFQKTTQLWKTESKNMLNNKKKESKIPQRNDDDLPSQLNDSKVEVIENNLMSERKDEEDGDVDEQIQQKQLSQKKEKERIILGKGSKKSSHGHTPDQNPKGTSVLKNKNEDKKEDNQSNQSDSVKRTKKETQLQTKLKRLESTNFHPKKFMFILLILILSFLQIFLRGSKNTPSIIGVKTCDKYDWTIFACISIFLFCLLFLAVSIVQKEQSLKKKCKWKFHPDEKEFNTSVIKKSGIAGLFSGFLAAVVGIGGGMITNPILMDMNLKPEVVSFTGMYLILCNKIIITAAFIFSGLMPLDYFLLLGTILGGGVIIVEWKVKALMKKLGRQSFLGFILLFALVMGLVLTIIVAVQRSKMKIASGQGLMKWKDYCPN